MIVRYYGIPFQGSTYSMDLKCDISELGDIACLIPRSRVIWIYVQLSVAWHMGMMRGLHTILQNK